MDPKAPWTLKKSKDCRQRIGPLREIAGNGQQAVGGGSVRKTRRQRDFPI